MRFSLVYIDEDMSSSVARLLRFGTPVAGLGEAPVGATPEGELRWTVNLYVVSICDLVGLVLGQIVALSNMSEELKCSAWPLVCRWYSVGVMCFTRECYTLPQSISTRLKDRCW